MGSLGAKIVILQSKQTRVVVAQKNIVENVMKGVKRISQKIQGESKW